MQVSAEYWLESNSMVEPQTTVNKTVRRGGSGSTRALGPHTIENPLLRYSAAIASVITVSVIRLLLEPVLQNGSPFILSVPAVLFSAWYCGIGPATLATLLGGALGAYVMEPEMWQTHPESGLAGVGLYLIASLLVTLLAESQRNGQRLVAEETESRLLAEGRLVATLNSVGDAVIAVDTSSLVTYLNPVAELLTGWCRDEAIGRPCSEIFRIIQEETRETAESPVERVLRNGVIAGLANSTILITKHGKEYPIDDSGAPIRDSKGTVVGAVLIFRDITEQHHARRALEHSRNELSAIYNNSPTMMCLLDEDRKVLHVNQAFRRFVGSDSKKEIAGVLGDVVGCRNSLEDPRGCGYGKACKTCPLKAGIADTLITGKSHEGIEHRIDLTNGQEVVLTGSTAKIGTGGENDLLLCLQDITQLRKAEEALRGMNRALERMVDERTSELNTTLRELESFCHHVAHDFRTPLRSIIATSRILKEEAEVKLSEDERVLLGRQEASALKLSKLIDSLLEYARIGRLDWEDEPLNLTELVKQIASQVSDAYPSRGIRFDIEEGMVTPGDASMVRLLVYNLLENAAKYSPDGGVVTMKSEPQMGGFSITDQGIGFDPEYAERIFLPFERLHRDTEYRGTGIGLANARRIAERHGGRLWATSEGAGKGATFVFTLH